MTTAQVIEVIEPVPVSRVIRGVHTYDVRLVDWGKQVYLLYPEADSEPSECIMAFRLGFELTFRTLKVFDPAVHQDLSEQCALASVKFGGLEAQLRQRIQAYRAEYGREGPIAFEVVLGSWTD